MKIINVKVKKEFLDRRTGQIRKEGTTFTVTDERLREIKRSGDYVEVVKAPETPETPKTSKKEN